MIIPSKEAAAKKKKKLELVGVGSQSEDPQDYVSST
jgi:hypothetical protein